MFKKLVFIASLLAITPVFAQSVQQSGSVTRGHVPYWVTSGVVSDSGASTDSAVTSFGVTNEGGPGFCVSSARASAAGRNQLCLSASTTGPATISLQNYGTANPQALNYVINGTTIAIPTGGGTFIFGSGPFTAGNVPCFLNSTGTIQDCGLSLASGTITAGNWNGTPIPILYGGTGTSTASGARTNLGLGSIATQDSSAVSITGGAITGMPSPTANTDVATKAYVDAVSSGLNILAPSGLATAAVLPNTPTYSNGTLGVGATLTAGSNTTLTVDGTVAVLNTVVLVKNQASDFQNGIYTVTTAGGGVPWVLTRATYFDQAAEMKAGSYTFITAGSVNVNSSFTLQTAVAVVGTDPVTFVQFSAGAAGTVTSATIAAGTGISVAGTCMITTNGICTISNTGVTSVATGLGLLGGAITTTGTVSVDPTALRQSFGGRLTLVAGSPYMSTDQVGAQNLYYSPDGGRAIPVRVSGTWGLYAFTSGPTDQTGLTLALGGSANWAADSIHDVFGIVDSGTLKLATRLWDAGMYPTTVAITNATTITTGTTPTAWTRATAAFNGTPVQNGAASATIAPINAGVGSCLGQDWGVGQTKTVSQVVITAPTDHFILSNAGPMNVRNYGSSDGAAWTLLALNWINDASIGATYTLPINVSTQLPYRFTRTCFDSSGFPANNLFVAQIVYYNTVAPAAGRRLTYEDGILVNDASMTARTAAGSTVTVSQFEGSFLGTAHIDTLTAGQITAHFTYGPSRTFGVWNNYHQTDITLQAGISATSSASPPASTSYTVSSQLFVGCQSGSTFSLQAITGMPYTPVVASLTRAIAINTQVAAAGYETGIGVDNTSAFSGTESSNNIDSAGQVIGFTPRASLVLPPYSGLHTLYCLERVNNGSGTVTGFTDVRETVMQAGWKG